MMMSGEVHPFTGVCFPLFVPFLSPALSFLQSHGSCSRTAGSKQPQVTTHLAARSDVTPPPRLAADGWKTQLTAQLTTIATHLCMIYISTCDLRESNGSLGDVCNDDRQQQ